MTYLFYIVNIMTADDLATGLILSPHVKGFKNVFYKHFTVI